MYELIHLINSNKNCILAIFSDIINFKLKSSKNKSASDLYNHLISTISSKNIKQNHKHIEFYLKLFKTSLTLHNNYPDEYIQLINTIIKMLYVLINNNNKDIFVKQSTNNYNPTKLYNILINIKSLLIDLDNKIAYGSDSYTHIFNFYKKMKQLCHQFSLYDSSFINSTLRKKSNIYASFNFVKKISIQKVNDLVIVTIGNKEVAIVEPFASNIATILGIINTNIYILQNL